MTDNNIIIRKQILIFLLYTVPSDLSQLLMIKSDGPWT